MSPALKTTHKQKRAGDENTMVPDEDSDVDIEL